MNTDDSPIRPEPPRSSPVDPPQSHPHAHAHFVNRAGELVLPAWRRATNGEARWPAVLAVLTAMALQFLLPERLELGSSWITPAVEGSLLIGLMVISPGRITF